MRNLISKERTKEHTVEYNITEKGVKTAETILNEWQKDHEKEYNKFMDEYRKRIKT